MRISDWSSDVCSSDLIIKRYALPVPWRTMAAIVAVSTAVFLWYLLASPSIAGRILSISIGAGIIAIMVVVALWPIEKRHLIDRVLFWVAAIAALNLIVRSEEHTSALQSLMRISYAV